MGIEQCERARERERDAEWTRAWRGRRTRGPTALLWEPENLLSVALSLWHTCWHRWRILCSFAAQLWHHASTSAAATPPHSSLLLLMYFFLALHLVQRRKRYLAIWKFGGDCCWSVQTNNEIGALGTLCVVWQKYSSWTSFVGFGSLFRRLLILLTVTLLMYQRAV